MSEKMFEDSYSHETNPRNRTIWAIFSKSSNKQSSKVDCTAALSKQSPWHSQNMKQQSSNSNTRSIKYARRAVNARWKTSMPTHIYWKKFSSKPTPHLATEEKDFNLSMEASNPAAMIIEFIVGKSKQNHSLASLGLAPEKLDDQSNTRKTLFQPP